MFKPFFPNRPLSLIVLRERDGKNSAVGITQTADILYYQLRGKAYDETPIIIVTILTANSPNETHITG